MRAGQALIEVILALAITGLTLMAIVSLSTRSVSNVSNARDSSEANLLATQGVEWIKDQRQNVAAYANWTTFSALTGASGTTYCQDSSLADTWAPASVMVGDCNAACAEVAPGYKRQVRMYAGSGGAVNASVKVFASSDCTELVNLETVFTNYR